MCGLVQNGLDLNAPEGLFKADDYVVAVAVAPRFGDGKTQVCSLAHEGKLSKFSAAFRVEFGRMSQFIRLILIGH